MPHKKNEILEDLRRYRVERLKMNHPKGWEHMLRIFEDAWENGFWSGNLDEYLFAQTVLTRLVRLEKHLKENPLVPKSELEAQVESTRLILDKANAAHKAVFDLHETEGQFWLTYEVLEEMRGKLRHIVKKALAKHERAILAFSQHDDGDPK